MYWVLNFLVCIGVVIYCVEGSVEDLKLAYERTIMECFDQYQPSPEEIEQLKARNTSDSETIKCLLACAYKKNGMMDDKGMFSVEGTNKIVETYYSDDPEELEKGKQYIEICKSVNDAAVSDGEKGCDRATLLFQCVMDHMPGNFNA